MRTRPAASTRGSTSAGETVGLITYMRTDGLTHISSEALVATSASVIFERYGDALSAGRAPRLYKSKAKNAQEAHEAIRPTNLHPPARAV